MIFSRSLADVGFPRHDTPLIAESLGTLSDSIGIYRNLGVKSVYGTWATPLISSGT